MEDDQRLNTLVHEGDALHISLQYYRKTVHTVGGTMVMVRLKATAYEPDALIFTASVSIIVRKCCVLHLFS